MKLQTTFLYLLHFLLPRPCESWYKYIVPYEKEFTITCPIYHDPPFQPHIYWLLPTKKLVTSNYSDETYQISGNPAANLTIKSTSVDTFGVYYCLAVFENQTLNMSAVGINVDVTLWHLKYKSQVITGLIAAVCLMVFLATFCLVSEFQYKEPHRSNVLRLDDPNLFKTYENCSISITDESIDDPASAEENTKTRTNSTIEQANL